MFGLAVQVLRIQKMKAYIPDFNLAFEHFCIHTGGAGVVAEIEKQLQLQPESVQPTKDTLYRWGNVSSSSIWCHLPTLLHDRSICSRLPVQDSCFYHNTVYHIKVVLP